MEKLQSTRTLHSGLYSPVVWLIMVRLGCLVLEPYASKAPILQELVPTLLPYQGTSGKHLREY